MNNKADLTKEQLLMLALSDEDIEAGRLVSQDVLDEQDLTWLEELTH